MRPVETIAPQGGFDPAALVARERPVIVKKLAADWPIVERGREGRASVIAYLKAFDAGRPVVGFTGDPAIGGRFFYNDEVTALNFTASRVNKKAADGLDLPALLDRIEKEMPKATPEVQWTMNNTLGAIGIHHPEHRDRVLAIGERIGLYRDWPMSKGCIPPYVPVWVDAMVKRQG